MYLALNGVYDALQTLGGGTLALLSAPSTEQQGSVSGMFSSAAGKSA
jgi:hypothetical protein